MRKPAGQRGHAIRSALVDGMAMLVEGHGSDTTMACRALIDVPGIKGGIRRHMDGIKPQGEHRAEVEGAVIGHIVLVKGLGIFGQHHIAVISGDSGSDAGAIAPEILLNFLGRAVRLLLVGGALNGLPICYGKAYSGEASR
jgi:hypothetical protein